MRPTALGVAMFAALALPATLTAQDTLPITSGTRVRVSAPDLLGPGAVTANVVALRGDTLLLRTADAEAPLWSLPLPLIERLEVSRGRSGRGGQGALIGFAVGAAVGGLLGAVASQGEDNPLQGAALGIAAGGGLIGAVVGGVIGANASGDRWERVPLPGHVGIMPRRTGAPGLSMSVALPLQIGSAFARLGAPSCSAEAC